MLALVPGPVRYMSVRSPGRTGETADRHGQRPCTPASSSFTCLVTWDKRASAGVEAVMSPPEALRRNPYAEQFLLTAGPKLPTGC
jgi:hypothetical protein